MGHRLTSIRHAVKALILTQFLVAGMAGAAPVAISPSVNAVDEGAVDPNSSMSAAILVNNPKKAAFDAAVASLYDVSSSNYHRWMSESEISSWGPVSQNVALLQASLRAEGFQVDQADDGGMLRITGSAAKFQSAFGAPVHLYRSPAGASFLRLASAAQFQGAHAELIAGVAGVAGAGMRPMLARPIDFATGQTVAPMSVPSGTSPLAAFTNQCFNPSPFTATLSGFSPVIGGIGSGAVTSVLTGPTYLSTASSTARPACGSTVQQLLHHYGIDEAHALGLTGRNQTIVIVDAYGSPTLETDVDTFSKTMGLPTMDSNSLEVLYPNGNPATTNADWKTETTLDVEWAHAFAPGARIVVVVAPTADDSELASAVEYAAKHRLGNVISNSWGQAEASADAATAQLFDHVFRGAAARGIAVNVATGDSGDFGVGSPVGAASIPADSRWSTGVGGTSIDVPSDKGPVEAAWGITLSQLGLVRTPLKAPALIGFLQGGGGGESAFIEKPGFQWRLPGQGRQLPDISALADPQTGAIVEESDSQGAPFWGVVGGTSLATPIFSAIWVLADQAAGESLGQAAPILGELPGFATRDVVPIVANHVNTQGTITFRASIVTDYTPAQLLGIDQTQPNGFVGTLVYVGRQPFQGWNVVGFGTDSSLRAQVGWDDATGYGVPNGIAFIESAAFFGHFHRGR
jgi:subtilase family serine protease